MNKIEAAERMAESISRFTSKTIDCENVGQIRRDANNMHDALSAYRSASVPSDADLGRVAYSTTGLTAQYEWNDLTEVQRRKWTEAAAAVREWVQRDGLTEEEREAVIALVDCHLSNAELRANILRKLGHEPVWEWDDDLSTWRYRPDEVLRYPFAVAYLVEQGVNATVYYSGTPDNKVTRYYDSVAEAKAWCEQQLREARQ